MDVLSPRSPYCFPIQKYLGFLLIFPLENLPILHCPSFLSHSVPNHFLSLSTTKGSHVGLSDLNWSTKYDHFACLPHPTRSFSCGPLDPPTPTWDTCARLHMVWSISSSSLCCGEFKGGVVECAGWNVAGDQIICFLVVDKSQVQQTIWPW